MFTDLIRNLFGRSDNLERYGPQLPRWSWCQLFFHCDILWNIRLGVVGWLDAKKDCQKAAQEK